MSHTVESRHIWTSHVTYGCNAGCSEAGRDEVTLYVTVSYVTYGWVTSLMNESCHTWMECRTPTGRSKWSHVVCNSELCHIRLSHVTYERVMSHMGGTQDAQAHLEMKLYEKKSAEVADVEMQVISPVMNESCLIYMSHVTYVWVMSHMYESCHICMSHVAHMKRPMLKCRWQVMSRTRHVMSRMRQVMSPMRHVSRDWVMSQMHESCQRGKVMRKDACWSSRRWNIRDKLCHKWVMSRINESCHICMSHVTYQWVMLQG